MGLFQKIIKSIRKKEFVEYGGFELLSRLTGSTGWSKEKMLKQYATSLYVFSCVDKIAEKVSASELNLFQLLNSRGDTKEVINHTALDLIFKPNPFQTKAEFLKITTINKKLTGDAFWYKIRNDRGQVVELWNLRPDRITIVKDPVEFIKGYELKKFDGSKVFYAAGDIVHMRYPSPLDEFYGISPIPSASVRIETEKLASSYQRDFFLNQARPDAILTTPDMVGDEEKEEIRDSWGDRHKGIGKNSKISILEGDLKYQQISISQREMDYIESLKFTRDDILVAFHVPKAVIAITDDVNRANAETSMKIFLSETIKPELQMLTEDMNQMLIIPDFGQNLFIDYVDPTPEDREQTLKEYENGITKNWLLINEVRSKENLPPIEGGWNFYLPLSSVSAGGLEKSAQKKLQDAWEQKKIDESRDRGLKYFRGKASLRQRFIIAEEVVAGMKKQLSKPPAPAPAKKDESGEPAEEVEKTPVSLIKGDDLRNGYANLVIKLINNKAERLKSETNKMAAKQLDDLLIMLGKLEDLTKASDGSKRKAMGSQTSGAVDKFYKEAEPVWAEFVFPFIEEFTRLAGVEAMGMVNPDKGFEMTPAINKILKKRAEQFGLSVNTTTREKITRAIDDGLIAGESMIEISNRVNDVYSEYPDWRSDLIARTESTAANNEGFIEAYKQSDVATHKEWIATKDDRVRDAHLAIDGEIVPVDKAFSNGLQYPQEPNCRCVLGPALEE